MEICRVCLRQEENMKFINKDEQHCVPRFSDLFTAVTTVRIDDDSGLSNRICQVCTNRILDAYELRRLALASDFYLRFPNVNVEKHIVQHNIEVTKTDINKNALLGEPRNGKNKFKCQCHVCSKTFMYESELQRHKLTHEPGFKCSICHKVFGFKSSLHRHERQHTRGRRLPCPQCTSNFPDKSLLKRHIQYVHQEKKHSCVTCSARFGSASALQSHVRSHSGPALRCGHAGCDRSFLLLHHLKRHEAAHTGNKTYFCDDCGKGFIQAHHLVSHLATHRPDQRLPCPLAACTKTFPTKYALNRHMLVHEKNLTCEVCGKYFTSDTRLRRHLLQCKSSADPSTPSTRDANYAKRSSSTDKIVCNSCQELFTSKYMKKHQLSCNNNTSSSVNSVRKHDIDKSASSSQIKENMQDVNSEVNYYEIQGNQTATLEYRNRETELHHRVGEATNTFNCPDEKAETVTKPSCQPPKGATNIEEVLESGCNGCRGTGCRSTAVSSNINTALTSELQNNEDVRKSLEMRNDCKGFLGKCIVGSGADGIGEECICAKVSYEDPLPEYLTTPLLVALEKQGYYPS